MSKGKFWGAAAVAAACGIAFWLSWHGMHGYAAAIERFSQVSWGFPLMVDIIAVYAGYLVIKRRAQGRGIAWPLIAMTGFLGVSLISNVLYIQHWIALVPPLGFFTAFELLRGEHAYDTQVQDEVQSLQDVVAARTAEAEWLQEQLQTNETKVQKLQDMVQRQAAEVRELKQTPAPALQATAGVDDQTAAIVQDYLQADAGRSVSDKELKQILQDELGVSERTVYERLKPFRVAASNGSTR